MTQRDNVVHTKQKFQEQKVEEQTFVDEPQITTSSDEDQPKTSTTSLSN